jgi:hypothetical protein
VRKKAATGEGCRCATKLPTSQLAAVEAAEQAQKLRVVEGGSSPASKRRLPERGESREGLCRCATKPPTPRLAAVEAAEQAKKFRVVGGGELAGVGKEAAGGGESWDGGSLRLDGRQRQRRPDRWRRRGEKEEKGKKEEEEDVIPAFQSLRVCVRNTYRYSITNR